MQMKVSARAFRHCRCLPGPVRHGCSKLASRNEAIAIAIKDLRKASTTRGHHGVNRAPSTSEVCRGLERFDEFFFRVCLLLKEQEQLNEATKERLHSKTGQQATGRLSLSFLDMRDRKVWKSMRVLRGQRLCFILLRTHTDIASTNIHTRMHETHTYIHIHMHATWHDVCTHACEGVCVCVCLLDI